MLVRFSIRVVFEHALRFVLARAILCKLQSKDIPFQFRKRKSSLGGPFQFSTCLDVLCLQTHQSPNNPDKLVLFFRSLLLPY